ncbi:MAG: phosphoribosylanthranilate isomerase, partial [Planctomycetaceae bacterium]|nr:phosphoribosylanthranilate isomerase [Planctomycetaceae bacterium]
MARAGASAIGLNFFEKSKRAVNLDQASEIAAAVRGELDLVGLFVNHSRDDVFEIAREVELDWIQLHGDESVEFLRELQSELPNVRLMKAFRIGADGFAGMARFLEECVTSNVTL